MLSLSLNAKLTQGIKLLVDKSKLQVERQENATGLWIWSARNSN